MKRICREPLVHFLLLGAALFGFYAALNKNQAVSGDEIVVATGQIENLAATFANTWQRPPTTEELTVLIRDHVQEEVYCREAIALGLDKNDTVIRRRLRQKMEFVSDDVAALVEPTDNELSAYLKTHAETFRMQPQFTFSHVYLNPQRRGKNLTRDTWQLLAQLQQAGDKGDVAEASDPFLLEHTFQSLPASEVAKQFGEQFAVKLGELPLGQWQGPIESGYGVHLVRISERTEGRLPDLAEVRDAVRREWAHKQRLEANEKSYQGLLKRYAVTIEAPPQVPAGGKKLAQAK